MIIQQQQSKADHANMGSVALPAVLRAGGSGESQFQTGSIGSLKFPQVSNQAHAGHMAQAVSLHALHTWQANSRTRWQNDSGNMIRLL